MTATPAYSVVDAPGTLRPLLRLALPVLAEQLLNMLVGITDRFLTGNFLIGEQYFAAMNQVAYLLWMLTILFAAVAIGATALVARFVGAGDQAMARRTANQALTLGAIFSAAIVLAGYTVGHRFVGLLGLESHARELAERNLAILLLAVPPMMFEQVGIACLRGAGDTVSGMVAMSVLNGVNMVVSTALVVGIGPVPRLGWVGLAIGTTTGYYCGAIVILWRLFRSRAGLRPQWQLLRPALPLMRRLLRVGLPGGADMLAIVLCHLWYLSIVNGLGDLAAAAHGIAVVTESTSYLPGVAFQVAASTMAGQYLGARDPQRATRSVRTACLVGGGIMTTMGVMFFVFARQFAQFFVSSSQGAIAEAAMPLLHIVAFTQPFLALAMIISGALRGAGDTRWPLVFTFIGFLVVRIPLAHYLALPEFTFLGWHVAGLGLGVVGAWYAMAADIVTRCVLICFRFLHGGWTRVRV